MAIARALSDESFTGWRFDTALFSVEKCSVSRQSSARRKVWSRFSWEKRRTERGPTKSGRVLDEVMEGRVETRERNGCLPPILNFYDEFFKSYEKWAWQGQGEVMGT